MTEDMGAQIREARQLNGWTQADLAARLEVTKKTVGGWERTGEVPKVRWRRLEQVLDLGLELKSPEWRTTAVVYTGRDSSPVGRLKRIREQLTLLRAEVDELLEALAEDSDTPQA
jgi:ribosome-binding protein aMBF1 (putative translation factor)